MVGAHMCLDHHHDTPPSACNAWLKEPTPSKHQQQRHDKRVVRADGLQVHGALQAMTFMVVQLRGKYL
jgi:hypothetical protein